MNKDWELNTVAACEKYIQEKGRWWNWKATRKAKAELETLIRQGSQWHEHAKYTEQDGGRVLNILLLAEAILRL